MKHPAPTHPAAPTVWPLAIVITILGMPVGCGGPSTSTPQGEASPAQTSPEGPISPEGDEPAVAEQKASLQPRRPADDGRMLWAPPHAQRSPIAASRLPESAELVLLTKPSELAGSDPGARFLQALALALDSSAPDTEPAEHAISASSGDAYGSVLVSSTSQSAVGGGALLSQAFEELLKTSADTSDIVLLVSLPWIAGEGGGLMDGLWAPLGDALRREIDDEWRAAMLSVETLEERDAVYWELRLVGGRGVPETRRARQLARLAKAWRDELSRLASESTFSPHARELLRALPGMLDVLGRRTRVGADDGQTVANGYLPASSLHNLLLAAQLLIAEQSGAPQEAVAAPSGVDETLAERLAKPVTIRFARESLEAAVAIVGESVGAPITINGRDLQLRGITRNQMVGLNVSEKPASQALVELLLQANPDTEATGPTDRRQQLVFVVDKAAGEIVITTRSAAAERADQLPDVFLP